MFGWELMLVRVDGVGRLDGSQNILTDVEWPAAGVTIPPLDKLFIVGCLMPDFPIELWYAVVYPSVVHPE